MKKCNSIYLPFIDENGNQNLIMLGEDKENVISYDLPKENKKKLWKYIIKLSRCGLNTHFKSEIDYRYYCVFFFSKKNFKQISDIIMDSTTSIKKKRKNI
jgi:hypothetical protein